LGLFINKKCYSSRDQYRNEKFCGVLIEGLKPLVERTYSEIIEFIDSLPKNNKLEKLYVSFGKVDEYMTEDRVK
jgi:hypothetical protein